MWLATSSIVADGWFSVEWRWDRFGIGEHNALVDSLIDYIGIGHSVALALDLVVDPANKVWPGALECDLAIAEAVNFGDASNGSSKLSGNVDCPATFVAVKPIGVV